MHARSLSHVGLFANPCTVACQALLSMGFSRQAYWSGLPFPPPEDLPNQESNLCLLKFLHWQVDSFYHWATQKVPREWVRCKEINFHGFLMLWIRRMQRFLINPGSPDASEPLRTRVLKDFSKTKVAAIEGHLQFLIPGEGLDIKLATLCCVLGCFTCAWLFAAPWTVTCQASLSMGISSQEYWSVLQLPPPGDLPNPRIEPAPPMVPALAGGFFSASATCYLEGT